MNPVIYTEGLGVVDALTPGLADIKAEALLGIVAGIGLAIVFWGAPKIFGLVKRISK